jgi:hypothetical protein
MSIFTFIEMKQLNFLEYLGTEEQNLLTGLMLLKGGFDLFLSLDYIYQEPLKRLVVSDKEDKIPFELYRFIHFHLYFSMSCLLRYHISESLSSTRKAIDAALTAYKLILEPSTTEKYIKRDNYFKFIKSNMQNERKKDINKYPLAAALIALHDLCSEYGSHADIKSFSNRLEARKSPDTETGYLMFHYFEILNPVENQRLYFQTLKIFYSIFKIFKSLFDRRLKIVDTDWEFTIKYLDNKVDESLNRLKA